MGSRDNMEWLPGLGKPSHSNSDSLSAPRADLETGLNTQTANPKVDEVEYPIVCDDCGKHFWSRTRADYHAALTAHVLHEEITSPSSPVSVPDSPTADSEYDIEMNAVFGSAAEAEATPDAETSGQEDGGDSEDEEYSVCSECRRQFWSREAANDHATKGHMKAVEMGSFSAPDMSPNPAAATPAIAPKSPAASPSIIPSSLCWDSGPGSDSSASDGGLTPTSPYWTTNQTAGRSISPTFHDYYEVVSPISTSGITSSTSGQPMVSFGEKIARPLVPDASDSDSKSDDNLRRSPGVSPSPSASVLPLTREVPRSVNVATQTDFPPATIAPPSPSSSNGTLESPQVTFPRELSDRIFFIVTPSGNRKGPSFIMGLAEAQNAATFRMGVRGRLESQGERVGLREIVARIPWLSVPVYADTDEDHYHMCRMVRHWPQWYETSLNTSCHIFVTLEDEKAQEHLGAEENRTLTSPTARHSKRMRTR